MDSFAAMCYTVPASDAGWLGTARQIWVNDMTDRLADAIVQRADDLGVEVHGLEALGPARMAVMIVTGTAKEHLGADKLCAYIEGLQDALADTYGNPPAEVGRKDLKRVLDALGRMLATPELTAAAKRLWQVLDEPSQRP